MTRSSRYSRFLCLAVVLLAWSLATARSAPAPALAQAGDADLGTYSIGRVDIPLVATGGSDSYTWELAAGSGSLPPGVALGADPAAGNPAAATRLAGIATTPGTYTFTLRVTSGAESADKQYTIAISSLMVRDADRLPDAFAGRVYAYALTALRDGHPLSAIWEPIGALPAGITLRSDGVLESGASTAPGRYDISFSVTDGLDKVQRRVAVNVSAIDITTPAILPNATRRASYAAQLAATGGSGAFRYQTADVLGGLTLDAATGLLSGDIDANAGPLAFTVTVVDTSDPSRSQAKRFSINVVGDVPAPPSVKITDDVLADCTIGVPCSRAIGVSDGVAPFTWSATGLPPGLELRSGTAMTSALTDPAGAELSGTAAASGSFTMTVNVTDATGSTTSCTVPLTVSELFVPETLPTGTIDVPYSTALAPIGGRGPYTTTRNGGTLPVGLAFDAEAVLSGIPRESGAFTLRALVVDADGRTLQTSSAVMMNGGGSSTISIVTDRDLGKTSLGSYSRSLIACCPSTLVWSVESGGASLPPASTLTSAGVLSGTAMAPGIFTFMVRATDPANASNYAQRQFTLEVTSRRKPAATATIAWNVDTDGFWDTASNWRDTATGAARVPNGGDTVAIDRGGASPVVTIRTNQSVLSLISSEAIALISGSLVIGGDSEIDGPFTIASALIVNGPLALAGQTVWSTGSISGSQKLTNTGTLTMIGAATKGLVDFNVDNAGTIVQAGGDLALDNLFGGGAVLRTLAGAVYEFRGDGGVVNGSGENATPHQFDNAGTIRKTSGTGTSRLTMFSLNNSGAIDVRTGTVQLGGSRGVANTGTFVVSAGAAIDLTGGASVGYSGGLSGSGQGAVRLRNGSIVATSGPLTFNMSPALFQWTGGAIDVGLPTSPATLTNVGTITLAGAGVKSFGGTLINRGTIALRDTGSLDFLRPATVTNEAGAVIDIGGDGSILAAQPATIANSGAVRKSAGLGTSTLSPLLNVTDGTIDVQSGTLVVAGAGLDTGGTINVAPAAVLNLTGSDRRMSGTYTGTGGGAVLLNMNRVLNGSTAATFNFAPGMLQWSAGTFDGAFNNIGTLTVGGVANVTLLGFLNNAGTIRHSGGLLVLDNVGQSEKVGSTLTNLATGLYLLEGDASIVDGIGDNGSPHLVNNLGTIRKSTGGSSAITPFTVVNDGTIDVRVGTVRLGGRAVSSARGVFTVGAGATLDLTGGALPVYTGRFEGSGAGQVRLAAGAVRVVPPGLTLAFSPGLLQWTGGGIQAGIPGQETTVTNAGSIVLSGSGRKSLGGTLHNAGTIVQQGAGAFELSFQDASLRPGFLVNLGVVDIQGDGGIGDQTADASVTNGGTLKKSGGGLTTPVEPRVDNTGTIDVRSGTLALTRPPVQLSDGTLTAGTWNVFANAALVFPTGAAIASNGANVALTGAASAFDAIESLVANTGSLTIRDGRNLSVRSTLTNSGHLVVGVSSRLDVAGNYAQSASASIAAEIGGRPDTGQFGRVVVAGEAALDGTFDAVVVNGFGPSAGDVFPVITFSGHTGAFNAINGVSLGGVPVLFASLQPASFVLLASTSAPDLAVASVDVLTPAGAPGQAATIQYSVVNRGTVPAAGEWDDFVYLSADNFLDPRDLLVGRVHHAGGVEGLSGAYAETLTAPIPASIDRAYRVIAVADGTLSVADVNRVNNVAVSAQTLSVSVPVLAIGGTVSGAIAAGHDAYYRLAVPPGSDLTVSADYAAAGAAELFIRRTVLPDRTVFDAKAAPLSAGSLQDRIDLANASGDYYLLLHGSDAAGTGRPFSISAAAAEFAVSSVSPNPALNQSVQRLVIGGSKFTPATAISLIKSDGATFAPQSVAFVDSTRLFATFDMSRLPPASYVVRAQDGSQFATSSSIFRIVDTMLGTPDVQFFVPEFIRVGSPFGATVVVRTLGAAAPLPYVQVSASGVQQGQEFEHLGSSGLPPFLNADESLALPTVRYVPVPAQSGAVSTLDFKLVDLDAVIDWNAQKGESRPATVSPSAWDAVWSTLRPRLGDTVANLFDLLRQDSDALNAVGLSVDGIDELLAFEIRNANFEFAFPILDASADLAFPAPGVPLVVGRAFRPAITGRYELGRLGRGWVDGYDVGLSTDSSGIVTIRQGIVSRHFVQQSDGTFAGPPGERGALTSSDGSYRLREPQGMVTVFGPDGLLAYVEDPNGNRVSASYDGALLTALSHSNGSRLTLTYNDDGRLTRVVDPAGRSVTYEYDESGEHLIAVTTVAGTTHYGYTQETSGPRAHALTSIANPGGTHVFFEYDAQGRLAARKLDGAAEALSFAYDFNSYRITDADGHVMSFFYDPFGQVQRVRDSSGPLTDFAFDAFHNLAVVAPRAGAWTVFGHDAHGNVTELSQGGGSTEKLTYEPAFNELTDWEDALTRRMSFGHDARGNSTSTTYPDGATIQHEYDGAGNLIRSVDRLGRPATYTYDSRGLLRTLRAADGLSIDYAYDERGNMRSATDARGAITMDYDEADRMTSIVYPNGRSLRFAYDAGGRRISTTDHAGFTVHHGYDTAGRLASLTDADGRTIVAYSYNELGRLARKEAGNGAVTTFTYDSAGHIATIETVSGNQILSRFGYTYDLLGRRRTATTVDGTSTYDYDALGRLTSVTLPDTRRITYEYDAAGNRTVATDNGTATSYTANELNEYVTVGDTLDIHDRGGNLILRTGPGGSSSYSYDALNRMIGVSTPAGTWSYEYDALGNRSAVVKNGERTEYLVEPAGLGNVVGEYDAAGSLIARYTYGLGLSSRIGANNVAAYYDADAVGSIVGVSGPAGTYVNRYEYLPFGEIVSSVEAIPNPFKYNGALGVQDDGSGLNFMRARSYSPDRGRFMQPDPLGLLGGTNLYGFALNDPVSLADPSGLETPTSPALIVAQPALILDGQVYGVSGMDVPLASASTIPGGAAVRTEIVRAETEAWIDWVHSLQAPLAPGSYSVQTSMNVQQAFRVADVEKEVARQLDRQFLKAFGMNAAKLTGEVLTGGVIAGGGFEAFYWAATGKLPPCDMPGLKLPLPHCDFRRTLPSELAATKQVTQTQPEDPNFISGPAGYGADAFIVDEGPWPYVVFFENRPTANAPAQRVVVSQRLDDALDLSTFELGRFGFGSRVVDVPAGRQFYNSRIDYRAERGVFVDVVAELTAATRTVTWTFTSIDPATLDRPANVLAGFLPPNVTAPEGDAFVTYFVAPRADLHTATRIDAQASIVFDANAPIATNVFTNTIDAGAPSSRASTPSTTESSTFLVSWSGVDDADGAAGSGVAGYDVFVSENGGAFMPFVTSTTQTSTLFTGERGKTYGFYSLARDNVGHVEASKTIADGVTTIAAGDRAAPTLTVPAALTVEATSGSGAVAVFTATAGDDVDGPVPVACLPSSGTTFRLGTTTVTCTATDTAGNAVVRSFDVFVVDTTRPALTVPAAIAVEAAGSTGAQVSFDRTAIDVVDGAVAVHCTPESGSTFPVGVTATTCTAADRAGNVATASATVTVIPPPGASTLAALAPSATSPGQAITATGLGFDSAAPNNLVVFASPSGSIVTARATAVAPLDVFGGLQRLTVPVPDSVPSGPVRVRVFNLVTKAATDARSVEIVSVALSDVTAAAPGASGVTVRLIGSASTRFVPDTTRVTFGPGITIRSTTLESPASLIVTVDVSPGAAIGTRDVAVVFPTGRAIVRGGFAVTPPPTP